MIIVTRNVELIRAAGRGFISSGAGVTVAGAAARRWVHLVPDHADASANISTQSVAYSASDGSFRFDNLPLGGTYLLIGREDSPRVFNDVIRSGIQPVEYPVAP